jgi:hypothetical protein
MGARSGRLQRGGKASRVGPVDSDWSLRESTMPPRRPTPIRLTLRESSAALAFLFTLRVSDAFRPSDAWLVHFAALGRVRHKLVLSWTERPVMFTPAEGDALLWALSTARVSLASASDRSRFHRRMLGVAWKMERAGWTVPNPDDGIKLVSVLAAPVRGAHGAEAATRERRRSASPSRSRSREGTAHG